MKHKPLARQLTAQFFRGNVPMFALAVFAALTGGTLNLIVTWLMQQLIDAASGLPGALPLGQLATQAGFRQCSHRRGRYIMKVFSNCP